MKQAHSQQPVPPEEATAAHACFRVLGVRIDAVQIPNVKKQMEEWVLSRSCGRFISFINVNSVMEARHDKSFLEALNAADLSVPDGMPLVWLGRWRGYPLGRRVYGPDLFLEFCRDTQKKGYRHFFYGGAPGIPEKLAEELKRCCPSLKVVGTYSPPFRPMTPEEDAHAVEMINQAGADVLWVGLGCPKQERWIAKRRDRLNVAVIAGIGQAFDIYSRRTPQAPQWMRDRGLEWLFRLLREPRRLWRRYLLFNTEFIFYLFLHAIGLRRSD